jgi:hypothetical protein
MLGVCMELCICICSLVHDKCGVDLCGAQANICRCTTPNTHTHTHTHTHTPSTYLTTTLQPQAVTSHTPRSRCAHNRFSHDGTTPLHTQAKPHTCAYWRSHGSVRGCKKWCARSTRAHNTGPCIVEAPTQRTCWQGGQPPPPTHPPQGSCAHTPAAADTRACS